MVSFTRLRLSGFKSFVDPTDMLILPGLTGVVGPNGCGKSNLVEALRWVMGETSAKSLRGKGMEDVIFAGAASRPARSWAEVSLAIDNPERDAPAGFNDAEHIEILRRIERDSGSSYRANGKEVRAKDVQLLFADLASGAHSPGMVRQGKIGQLIDAKPKDRRPILDEAAGIGGLHARRHEAELRLKAAQTNLERLSDVLGQMEARANTLTRQARQAKRYRQLSEAIAETEAAVLYLRWHEAREQAGVHQARFKDIQAEVARLTQEAAAATTAELTTSEAVPAAREEDAVAAAILHRVTSELERLTTQAAQAAENLQRLEAQKEQIDTDLARENSVFAEGREALESLEAAAAELAGQPDPSEQLETANAALTEAQAALRAVEADLDAATHTLAGIKAEAEARARRRQELERRIGNLESQAKAQGEERTSLAGHEATAKAQAAEAALIEGRNRLAGLERAAEDAQHALETARQREETARAPIGEQQSQVSALRSEAQTIERLLATGDPGDADPVMEALAVNAGYEAAVGAALGDDLNAPADENAPLHWRALDPYDAAPALPDGVTSLAEKVRAPAALARRLAQIGVVDPELGAIIQERLQPGQRLVTKAGDLWRWDGFTASADAPTPAAIRLSQRNRLEALHSELAEAEQALGESKAALERATATRQDAQKVEGEARNALRQAQAAVRDQEKNARAAQDAAQALSGRLAALDEAERRIASDLAETREALETLQSEQQGEADPAAVSAEVERLRTAVATAREQAAEARRKRDAIGSEAASLKARKESNAREQAMWRKRLSEAESQTGALSARRDTVAAERDALAGQPEELAKKGEAARTAQAEADTRRQKAADALATAEGAHKDAEKALRAAEKALAAARESSAREEATAEAAAARLEEAVTAISEKLGCGPQGAREAAGLDTGGENVSLPDLPDTVSRLERLTTERERLGAVNLQADQELEEIQGELEKQHADRDDLEAAIAKLHAAIAKLNREGRERLVAAFEIVRGHFERLYTVLFEGGTARLEWVESDDPLDAGLEIIARPPGKKPQTLSLLSGGEQALTAMALIFAVFQVNPAPICVLDEVDAPLDDANVERFCTLLDEMKRLTSTRFLVITHHPYTMARMDRLFGVTMMERGVSQLVSVDLNEADRLLAAE